MIVNPIFGEGPLLAAKGDIGKNGPRSLTQGWVSKSPAIILGRCAVVAEQGRIYRLCINGKLKTGEMAQMISSLREIRCSVEAMPPALRKRRRRSTSLRCRAMPAFDRRW